MVNNRWVKFGTNRATQVSTEGCTNVDDFIKACKKELSPLLDSYASVQISLFLPGADNSLMSSNPVPTENNEETALNVAVAIQGEL
jgi:hypothetical protein